MSPLIEGHFALNDTFGSSVRTLQRIVRTNRSAVRPFQND
jgi:hypothetical protein